MNAGEKGMDRGTAAWYSEAGDDLQILRAKRTLLWHEPGQKAGET